MAQQTVAEEEFIESIDAKFPYEDEAKVSSLILQARGISSNAAFMVLYEIVCAPTSVSSITKRQWFNQWSEGYHHRLVNPVREAAEAMLSGKDLSVDRVLELLLPFVNEPHQNYALKILKESCHDVDGEVAKKCDQLRGAWETSSPI